MKNEKLLFAAVAIIGLALSQALSGVKLPSGYDVGTVLAWVAGIGALGFAAQFFNSVNLAECPDDERDFLEEVEHSRRYSPMFNHHLTNIHHDMFKDD